MCHFLNHIVRFEAIVAITDQRVASVICGDGVPTVSAIEDDAER